MRIVQAMVRKRKINTFHQDVSLIFVSRTLNLIAVLLNNDRQCISISMVMVPQVLLTSTKVLINASSKKLSEDIEKMSFGSITHGN